MKVKDIFPWWGTERDTIVNYSSNTPELLISHRPPTEKDKIHQSPWWYDRSTKTMYRATKEGYVKD